jgi:GDP-L-fucose synthase
MIDIVITGGTGMVGKCINEYIVSSPYKSQIKATFLSSRDLDLTKRTDVLNYFANNKYKYIIHLAANVGGLYKNIAGNIEMFGTNVKMNENVLEACNLNNINRGIFCLSSCIYPANPSKFPMDETMIHEGPPHSSNEGYAYAKRMLEMQCRHYNKSFNREYICVVPVNLYGPYDNFNLRDGHLIPMLMHRFYLSRTYDIVSAFGTGKPLRQFLYAPDFAKIIIKILFGYVETSPIICCTDKEYTIKELVLKVMDTMDMDQEKLAWLTKKSDGVMKKTVSNGKLLNLFPSLEFTSLEDGLHETYGWFKENYNTIRK